MDFKKTKIFYTGSDSVGTLDDNLEIYGILGLRYGLSVTPQQYEDEKKQNIIRMYWEIAIGSGKTLYYWFHASQGWEVRDSDDELTNATILKILNESYQDFKKSFSSNAWHKNIVPYLNLPNELSNSENFHLDNSLNRLKAGFSTIYFV